MQGTNKPVPPYLVTFEGAARELNISVHWIRRRVVLDQLDRVADPLPHYKIGKLYRFNIEQLRAW